MSLGARSPVYADVSESIKLYGTWSLGLFGRNWTFPVDVDRLGGNWNGPGTFSWTSTGLTSRGLLEQPWCDRLV